MSTVKTREIKGYCDNYGDFYFTDRAIELDVEDGKGGMEKIIVADRKGNISVLDKLRKDFFQRKNIEVKADRTEFKDRSKAVNRIFGTTIEYSGIISVDSKPAYDFYTIQKTGSLCDICDGVRAAGIKGVK